MKTIFSQFQTVSKKLLSLENKPETVLHVMEVVPEKLYQLGLPNHLILSSKDSWELQIVIQPNLPLKKIPITMKTVTNHLPHLMLRIVVNNSVKDQLFISLYMTASAITKTQNQAKYQNLEQLLEVAIHQEKP